ncbi:MAG: Sir2 silent information regulator family NAD-dependent deacetylase [Acutalibacter sp.]|nr:Sir2 silent information regulator family NAD-dependent deacetylase [Acutalibacter sp.]
MFSRTATTKSIWNTSAELERLKEALDRADSVLIGAGAGLSTSAGFTYSGERFEKYFGDFAAKYGFRDMYSGGFYPYKTLEEHWAYWSRYVYINRYMAPPKPVYDQLYQLIKDRDYFVLTTNVDHCFQRAGFDKERLFYTQGDYGLFQCSLTCHIDTYDNYKTIRGMALAQGFQIDETGKLFLPENGLPAMAVPTELLPVCPKCGAPMAMNLRSDDTFVEDEGWLKAAERYGNFVKSHRAGRVLFLELGVGYNTPGIVKYPFWQMTAENPQALYACVNMGQAVCPEEIAGQSICIDGDIGGAVNELLGV